MKTHRYQCHLTWTGNLGSGTSDYSAYSRDFLIKADGKSEISGSSDPAFRGNAERWNPEELLVAAISSCHKLWYLHLCASAGVTVTTYQDEAMGTMVEEESGGGYFNNVLLRPMVTIGATSDENKALELHEQAHRLCFIANSLNFEVCVKATIKKENLT